MFRYQFRPPRNPVRVNSAVNASTSCSVNQAGSVSGSDPVLSSVSSLPNRNRQRFSGGGSPEAD
jgi:hypothetical protein